MSNIVYNQFATVADLDESHVGSQITFTHPVKGKTYTGEFVSVMAGTLGDDDPRLKVELIIYGRGYQAAFLDPSTPVEITSGE